MSEVKNAKIVSTHLGNEDHGIFTVMLELDYGGAGQSFGGYALDAPNGLKGKEFRRIGTAYGMEFIMGILKTLEIEKWEKLPGTYCRVKGTYTGITAIGHILKDQWFDPKEIF